LQWQPPPPPLLRPLIRDLHGQPFDRLSRLRVSPL
jgi:hypothetical protein